MSSGSGSGSDPGSGSDSDSDSDSNGLVFKRKAVMVGPPAKSRRLQSLDMATRAQMPVSQQTEPVVNDTDGLDPEAEYEAWKLREKLRVKREIAQIMAEEDRK